MGPVSASLCQAGGAVAGEDLWGWGKRPGGDTPIFIAWRNTNSFIVASSVAVCDAEARGSAELRAPRDSFGTTLRRGPRLAENPGNHDAYAYRFGEDLARGDSGGVTTHCRISTAEY